MRNTFKGTIMKDNWLIKIMKETSKEVDKWPKWKKRAMNYELKKNYPNCKLIKV